MKIGIKIKLAVILSAILLLTTSLVGVIMITQQRASLNELMRSMAGTIATEFASNSKMPLMQRDNLALNILVENLLKNPGIYDAYIVDQNFIIEGHRDLAEVEKEYSEGRELIRSAQGPPPWLLREEKGLLAIASPIVFKGTEVGYAIIFFSNYFILEKVRLAITSIASIAVLAILLVSLSSIPLASGLLRPIFRLFQGTKEIAIGNYDYRIPEKGKDEIGALVSSFNKMASELKKKEILKGVFNRYVSRHVADEILTEPERIRLGGDRREVTVFFADIRGFTAFSRKVTPEETVETLNRYFTIITEIIFRFEGTVDKFIGDAVMTVFGSPIRNEKHLEQGVKAAFAIKMAIEGLNYSRASCGQHPLQIGIGLDSGEVIVGNMGSQTRMEYTAVGDSVNMASRLTDLARGGDIIITGELFSLLSGNAVADKMEGVFIKGMEHPLTLYRLTGLKGGWKEEVDSAVESALTGLEREGFVL